MVVQCDFLHPYDQWKSIRTATGKRRIANRGKCDWKTGAIPFKKHESSRIS